MFVTAVHTSFQAVVAQWIVSVLHVTQAVAVVWVEVPINVLRAMQPHFLITCEDLANLTARVALYVTLGVRDAHFTLITALCSLEIHQQ